MDIFHLILSPSKDEVGTIVRSSWFDRLTMRTLLTSVVSLFLFAHASPLAADEPSIPVRVGPATIEVPESWLRLGLDSQKLNFRSLDLIPTLSQVDGFAGIDTAGILKVDIEFRHDHSGIADDWHVAGALADTKEALGNASPEDAASAFQSIPFEALYGGVDTNFGKSGVTALYLLGSVPTEAYGPVAVGAVISHDSDPPERFYTIAFLFDLDGEPFVARVTIKATRLFGPSDLGWIELATAIAHNRYDFNDQVLDLLDARQP